MKRLTIVDVILSALVVVLVAATLAPALGRAQRTAADARCQSNLRRWAEAMSAYTADNGSFYPTNRYRGVAIMTMVPLSQPDPLPGETQPPILQHGPNWVEALYGYLENSAAKTGQDWKSFRRCPNASSELYPVSTGNYNWAMNYVFNGSLVEKPSVAVRDSKKLMMIRELGRLTISTLRPSNGTCAENPNVKPQDPFLHNDDVGIGVGATAGECQLHGNGSYILFADGHVRHFDVSYYPDTAQISAATNWDNATAQWWNRVYAAPANPDEEAHNKAIAITP